MNRSSPGSRLLLTVALALSVAACHSTPSNEVTLTSISVSPNPTLAVGGTSQLTVVATYSDTTTRTVTSSATFNSSAPSIATVSDSGVVTAVAAGTATITATALGKSGTATVTVQSNNPLDALVVFDDNYGQGITFNPFGGSSNPPTIDTTQHHSGTSALKISVPATGYTGGAFKVAPAVNMSHFNAVTFWAKGSAAKTIDKVGMGNDSNTTTYATELEGLALTTDWQKYVLPLPLPSKLTSEGGAFFYAIGSAVGALDVWLDDVQYETLDSSVLGAPQPTLVSQTLNKAVGDTFTLGVGLSFPINGTAQAIAPSPAYFTFTSSNPAVATVNASGTVSVLANGTTQITAALGSTAASGTVSVTVSAGSSPTTAPDAPTLDAANVISLLSKAYTNVTVDTWNTTWSQGVTFTDTTIAGDTVKKYAYGSSGGFNGVEFTSHVIDATNMTYFHADVWTHDATQFKIKLVDFGADGVFGGGDDSEGEIINTFGGANHAQDAWVGLDIPLSNVAAAGLAHKQHLAQLVFSSSGGTVYVDNVYFHTGDVITPPPGDTLPIFTDDYASGFSFADFGGATNALSLDTDQAHSGTASLKVALPASGYTGGSIVAGAPQDLHTYDALTFWAKSSADITIDKVGFGNDANGDVTYQAEWAPVPLTPAWTKFIVPLPLPSKLTSVRGVFHFATGPAAGVNIWFDDIQYETVGASVLGAVHPAIATETLTKQVGDAFNVDGTSATWFLNGGSANTTEGIGPSYFTFTSSTSSVASVSAAGRITALAAGSTDITAQLGDVAADGKMTINVGAATAPTAAPARPTASASSVISLLSDAYTNVPVDRWSTDWDQADVADVTIGADHVKKYTNLNFLGVEVTSHVIDLTNADTFHLDVWTPTATALAIKLVDFGDDGAFQGSGANADTEGSVTIDGSSTPALAQNTWVSYDLPISAFVNAGLVNRKHLAQMIITATPGAGTLYLDNVYFHQTAGTSTPAQPLVIFGDDFASGTSFADFSGATNALTVDSSTAHSGSSSLRIDLPGSNYTGGAVVAATARDLSGYDALTFWAKASTSSINIDTVGFGNDAAADTTWSVEQHAVTLTDAWTKYVVPLPLASKLTGVKGLVHFATGPAAGVSVWVDDVQYEVLGANVLGAAHAAIATETFEKQVGDTQQLHGMSATWYLNGGSAPTTESISARYLTYSSSSSTVATVDLNGLATAHAVGSADLTAALGASAAAGVTTLHVSAASGPSSAPARPVADAADVISLLSGAYTNVTVDTWSAAWDQADVTDAAVGADTVKKYTALNYAGIEFTSAVIDATDMDAFHLDVWTPSATKLAIKLVDFGANGVYDGGGDDTAGELILDGGATPSLVQGAWVSYDLPLASFASAGLTARAHLAQLVITSTPGGDTLYVDNVYFHKTAVTPPAPPFVVFDEDYAAGVSFADFGGSTNAISIDASTGHASTSSLKVVVPSSGYTGGALLSASAPDLTGYNAVTFWAKANNSVTFDTVGLGNDNTATTPRAAERHGLTLTDTWQRFVIPIPAPAQYVGQHGLFHLATGANSNVIVWFDQIQYESLTDAEFGTVTPVIAGETLDKKVGDSFAVDGPAVIYGGPSAGAGWVLALPAKTAWFTYASSNTDVCTVDSGTATISAIGVGSADITAKLGGLDAGGKITVNVTAANTQTPPTAAPDAPTAAANTVVSLLTSVYTNHAIDGNKWRADWSSATLDEVTVGADAVKKYSNLAYVGVEFTGANSIDATTMGFFHVDVWTSDASVVGIKLVDFGPDNAYQGGDDSEGEVDTDTSAAASKNKWLSLDIPLSSFHDHGLTASPAHVSQLLFTSTNGATIYVDNVYFHQ